MKKTLGELQKEFFIAQEKLELFLEFLPQTNEKIKQLKAEAEKLRKLYTENLVME